MLSFNFLKLFSFNRSKPVRWPRRVGLTLEQLEHRLALSNDAPYVIAMVPNDNGQVSLQMSEDVINLDIGDFELLQNNYAIDLAAASMRAATASNYTILLPELSEGLFELRLVADGSNVFDLDGEPLQQDAATRLTIQRQSTTWRVEYSQTLASPTVQRIAALGDSMTYEGGGSYASVLRNMLSSNTISLQTFASAGWKAEKLYKVWQENVRDQGFDTLIVFSGIPDLSSAGATADSTFAQLRTLYDEATSHGLNVICMGLSPWAQYKKWTPERQAETLKLNNLIRLHVAEHSTTMRFVDTYAGLGSPDEPARLWPRFDVGDGLHVVPAGDERLATLVAAAVLSFIPSEPIPQSLVLQFSRDVFGLSPAHIKLTQSSSASPFQLTPIDRSRYRVDFTAPSSELSEFRLNLDLRQGLIVDDRFRLVGRQPGVILSIDYETPVVSLQSDQPSISSTATEHFQVAFSETVTDVKLANFKLLRDRVQLSPLRGTLTRLSESTFDLALDPSLTTPSGTYQLIYQPTLGIRDTAGNTASRGSILTWVKLDTSPIVSDGILKLSGTQGPDNLEVRVGQSAILYTLNGFEQSIPRDGIQRIEVQPGQSRDLVSLMVSAGAEPLPVRALSDDGLDRAYLYDSRDDDLFTSNTNSSSITIGAHQLTVAGFVQVTAISRMGNDRATLVDSSGSDTLEGGSRLTTLNRPGVEVNALNFPTVLALSQNGGTDIANLYDTIGDDNVEGTMELVTLNVPGYQISAKSFSRVNVRASQGNDQVTLAGSLAAERFLGQTNSSVWSSGSRSRYFYNFDRIDISSGGGNDTAKMYGSSGNDFFEARGRTASLTGNNFEYTVTGYKRVDAYSRAGIDTALLVGTAAIEMVTGSPKHTTMKGSSFVNVADGFARVTVESGGGSDVANLYDSAENDQLVGNPSQTTLSGTAYTIIAQNYTRVNVYASTGTDRAELTGSSGNDIYTGRPADSSLKGSAYHVFASGFDSVVAMGAGGGNDVANFYDSSGDDQAAIGPRSASMIGIHYNNVANDFARIQMFASSGNDGVEYTDSPGHDSLVGSGNTATITSPTLVATLLRFKSVRLSDTRGGINQIVRNAINYQLFIGAGWNS